MRVDSIPDPRRFGLFLGGISLLLAIQSLFAEHLLENVLPSNVDSLVIPFIDLLSVNAEQTIPTWYSTVLLFVAAVLLAFIAAAKQSGRDPFRRYWIGLAIIFGYLSMDEGAVIHEILVDPLNAAFDTGGYLAFSWQIVAAPLVIIFAVVYLRFLAHLSPRIRGLFVFSGTLYVGGALIVEAISANRWYVDGGVTFPYLAIGTVEELFEMLGSSLFIYALLTYMGEMETTAVFSFGRESKPGGRSVSWRTWHLGAAAALLIGINGALYAWATNQQGNGIANEPAPAPFARTIINRYAGQGVVALQINEPLEPENAAAPAIASSLLTLFEEVLVVALPGEGSSVAFAGQQLPFGQSDLSDALQQSGEAQFAILDTAALRNLAAGGSSSSADGQ